MTRYGVAARLFAGTTVLLTSAAALFAIGDGGGPIGAPPPSVAAPPGCGDPLEVVLVAAYFPAAPPLAVCPPPDLTPRRTP